jgi:hypothetical protein
VFETASISYLSCSAYEPRATSAPESPTSSHPRSSSGSPHISFLRFVGPKQWGWRNGADEHHLPAPSDNFRCSLVIFEGTPPAEASGHFVCPVYVFPPRHKLTQTPALNWPRTRWKS